MTSFLNLPILYSLYSLGCHPSSGQACLHDEGNRLCILAGGVSPSPHYITATTGVRVMPISLALSGSKPSCQRYAENLSIAVLCFPLPPNQVCRKYFLTPTLHPITGTVALSHFGPEIDDLCFFSFDFS